MRIGLVAPSKRTGVSGNDVTAGRWRGILEDLGHEVVRSGPDERPPAVDVLVALHARRSAPAVRALREARPDRPVVLALTGTDLYRDLDRSPEARRTLEAADRCVVLQPRALRALPATVRDRTRVIRQSAEPPSDPGRRPDDHLAVLVMAHLRPVKDPLRAAAAVRRLPSGSRVRVVHLGAALDPELEERARAESAANPRWEWRGACPRPEALRRLSRSHLLVLSSRLEGGANVVSEAIVCGVPVLASHVDGSVGMLGGDYPGYFPVGDTAALADLLQRVEEDEDLHGRLRSRIRALQPLHTPERERAAWASLLAELTPGSRESPD